MNDIVVSAVGVTKLLKGLNPSKALEPDELHPRVIKELASELGPVDQCLLTCSNNLLTRVKFPRNGLQQIYVQSLKKEMGLRLAITVRSP